MQTLFFIDLKQAPIYEQLKLEEALLRTDERNICLFNEGSPPSIVMGISASLEKWIDVEMATQKKIPIIRRFSGGGCVFVDEDTLFVSFIFAKSALPVALFPEPILRWTEDFYQSSLGMETFKLQENDYVLGEKKCGGNAQYIQKDRWLHHTTFLWDFQEENMKMLLFPPKTPSYRKQRTHKEFLTSLKYTFKEKGSFREKILQELKKRFQVHLLEGKALWDLLKKPHRKSVQLLLKNYPANGS